MKRALSKLFSLNHAASEMPGNEDENMSEEEFHDGEESKESVPAETDEEDEKLRAECEKMLPPELVTFADLLVKRFENKLDRNKKDIKKICYDANKRSKEAVKTAQEAMAEASAARSTAEEALDATREHGKQIQLLQDQVLSLQSGPPPKMSASKLNLKPLSAEERFDKLEKRYASLIDESNSITTFRFGRKKGEKTASMVLAKQTFSSFFPNIKFSISQPPNAKFFRVRVSDLAAARRLTELSKTMWVELNAVGWWMGPDLPEDMSKLEARARDFLKSIKNTEAMKKKIGFVKIEGGVLTKSGREILPLLFIPSEESGRWQTLGKMLADRIAKAQDDLLGMYDAHDNTFYVEWLKTAGYDSLAHDMMSFGSAVQWKQSPLVSPRLTFCKVICAPFRKSVSS